MNPNSSTEVSVRSDIVKDFESASERKLRERAERKLRQSLVPSKSLLKKETYKAAIDLMASN